jgi:hypothetical protein
MPAFTVPTRIDEMVAQKPDVSYGIFPLILAHLNQIEPWWFVLKNWMKQRWDKFECFCDCVDAPFQKCPNVHA